MRKMKTDRPVERDSEHPQGEHTRGGHGRSRTAIQARWLVVALSAAWIGAMGPAAGGQSNSLMDISSDGHLLACTNRDSGTVTILNLTTHEKQAEVAIGRKPEGVTFVGSSHVLAAAVYADDRVVLVDGDTGKLTGTVEVFDEPYGIVSSNDGTRLYVTLEYPGQVAEIDVKEMKVTRTIPAGRFPRGITLGPDGHGMLVTEYYTTDVLLLDVEMGIEVDRWTGASTDSLLRQIVLHPSWPKAYIPHMRSRVTAAHGAGSVFPYVSVVDTDPGEERRRSRFPMDGFRGNFVVANPWEVAVSPDGKQLYVIFGGTDDMYACDTVDDNYQEITLRQYLRLGHNPRAVRVSPDNKRLYVYNALDFSVVVYDTDRLREVTTISVTENPLGDEILKGKRLFYSALQPMVGRRWISCSSCHPDGDPDGRTWSNPEGLRNTPALFGLAWTHPLHWSADRDETQDFEHTIRGPLMQGRGLAPGAINKELGKPNKGLSTDLDAMAAYTNSHKFTFSPHAKNGMSKAARRGKQIFFSRETGCATCHGGPYYSDSNPRHKIVRHDVGTGEADPGEKMGPAYDTPTLLGIYRTAPYLHHGMARTLAEVFEEYNSGDRHGKTSQLSDLQIADLVEFLKSLPHEDPAPLAKKAGLKKVER